MDVRRKVHGTNGDQIDQLYREYLDERGLSQIL